MRELTSSARRRRRGAAVVGGLVLAVLTACGGQSEPLNPMVGADLTDDSMYGVVLDQPYTVASPRWSRRRAAPPRARRSR
ncbi:hypothetical protein [Nocardioides zeae]